MAAGAATHQHKRYGKHQKHTRPFLKVYWPYMPLAVIISIGLMVSVLWQPRLNKNVLAYATSTSINGLLQSTNQNRTANGVAALSLNALLNQSAQAKAKDMANRNYWSHNTPEGNPPWVFITQAGYDYKTAGENLAYGFATSNDTVTGWMNSPPHKANLLNAGFVDVGFGIASSSNYQNSGPETIVVAMYGAPLHSDAAIATSSNSSNQSTSPPQTKSDIQPNSSSASAPVVEPTTKAISLAAALTHYPISLVASIVSITLLLSIIALATRHALAIRKWLTKGERYVLHHFLFDITLISLIGLCVIVSQAAGYVK